MGRVRGLAGAGRQVRVGAPDASLTALSGFSAVTELVARLGVVASVDRHVGAVKRRARGLSAGEFLVQLASAQLLGEDVFAGFDRLLRRRGKTCWARRRCPPRRRRAGWPVGSALTICVGWRLRWPR